MHFDCVNGCLNSIKEIIWQTEAIYRCPLKLYTMHVDITTNLQSVCTQNS